jgi:uncharacterized protein (TIGR02594 family)
MSEAVKHFQAALKTRGFDPGAIDGWAGRGTAQALDRLLSDLGFEVAVRGDKTRLIITPLAEQLPVIWTDADLPPWMRLTLSYIGLHEVRDNEELREFLASDGATLGDPAEYPWCGDLVQTPIRRMLPNEPFPGKVGENPYLARNWLDFGEPCEPGVGAVVVFWRGDRNGIYGHVAYYWGEDDDHFYVLGGNQSNTISITKIARGRLLGARWPTTYDGQFLGPRRFEDPELALSVNEA